MPPWKYTHTIHYIQPPSTRSGNTPKQYIIHSQLQPTLETHPNITLHTHLHHSFQPALEIHPNNTLHTAAFNPTWKHTQTIHYTSIHITAFIPPWKHSCLAIKTKSLLKVMHGLIPRKIQWHTYRPVVTSTLYKRHMNMNEMARRP